MPAPGVSCTSVPCSRSAPSACETDGRRAETRSASVDCEIRRRTTTPWRSTPAERSARCQNRHSRRGPGGLLGQGELRGERREAGVEPVEQAGVQSRPAGRRHARTRGRAWPGGLARRPSSSRPAPRRRHRRRARDARSPGPISSTARRPANSRAVDQQALEHEEAGSTSSAANSSGASRRAPASSQSTTVRASATSAPRGQQREQVRLELEQADESDRRGPIRPGLTQSGVLQKPQDPGDRDRHPVRPVVELVAQLVDGLLGLEDREQLLGGLLAGRQQRLSTAP